jgi:hypothetical protein
MSKKVHISFSNGEVYSVPAKFIAEDRADYFASKHEGDEGTYEEIFEDEMWVLDDELELIDWMTARMDWEDIEDVATLEYTEEIDKSDEFMNADKELIE